MQPEQRPIPQRQMGSHRPLPLLMRNLQKRVARCSRCELSQTRQRTVFARGNLQASVCFVGEAPGAQEDAQGKPFVGRAGRLLDEMIEKAGLPVAEAYFCNIVKCRPPDNRRPRPPEVVACGDHLHEQLSIWSRSLPTPASKRIIVALGKTAIETLLGARVDVGDLRGQWKLYRGRVLLMPTYHPSFLLRPFKSQQRSRQQVADDLQRVVAELGIAGASSGPAKPALYVIPGGRGSTP